jgi:hypothetical protein
MSGEKALARAKRLGQRTTCASRTQAKEVETPQGSSRAYVGPQESLTLTAATSLDIELPD